MASGESPKKSTTTRLSAEGKELLRRIAKDLGITMAAALEISIREKAESRNLR